MHPLYVSEEVSNTIQKQHLLDLRYLQMARIWAENSYWQKAQSWSSASQRPDDNINGYNGTPSGFENIVKTKTIKPNPTFYMLKPMLLLKLPNRTIAAKEQRYISLHHPAWNVQS